VKIENKNTNVLRSLDRSYNMIKEVFKRETSSERKT
jgi:hypothetical protein